jgi:hypothetical protein
MAAPKTAKTISDRYSTLYSKKSPNKRKITRSKGLNTGMRSKESNDKAFILSHLERPGIDWNGSPDFL